jgi:thiol-disulfide isomerase/thioredoxin
MGGQMKNSSFWVAAVGLLVLVLLGVFFFFPKYFQEKSLPPVPGTSTPEAKTVLLPKVITLYQKGEGESDLAAFVSKELSGAAKIQAVFRAINVQDEPQMAEFYGVSNIPAIVFLLPSGKVYKKIEGYMDKRKILGVLAAMNKG